MLSDNFLIFICSYLLTFLSLLYNEYNEKIDLKYICS